MIFNSIRAKLLIIVISSFLISTVCIFHLADKKISQIIDTSQNELYREKVDTIIAVLARNNERLQRTGMVDTYLEDFQRTTIKELRQTFYHKQHPSIYPFITDTEGNIIMHPTLPENVTAPRGDGVVEKLLSKDQGEFEAVFETQLKYYNFRHFPPWQWIVGYTVPFDIKYADAREFSRLLLFIMSAVTLTTILFLIIVITKFTGPITRLTHAAKAMAGGNLSEKIEPDGRDEISTLARSFNTMQDAIKRTIEELKEENTERKIAEQQLAREKEQLSVTLRSIGDGVITTELNGTIVLMNRAAETITGWSNQEACGRSFDEVFQTVAPNRTRMLDTIVESDRVTGISKQDTLISKDGRELIIASSGSAIRDTKNKTIGVVMVFRDITDQIQREEELLKSKKLESIGVLAGGIAHDFNNILAAILGNISLALMDRELTEKTKKLLTGAEKASNRAKGLTQQLLTFSKGGSPVKEVSSLSNVIKESADFVLLGQKTACTFDIPEELWTADIDKNQISQVIQNIVLNGNQAMSLGGTIHISCKNIIGGKTTRLLDKGQKYVSISISDSGPGIPDHVIDKIFDPYFSTKEKGSGLGLSICHSIITKHDGLIDVESTQGEGTTFTIYLPTSGTPPVVEEKAEANVRATHPATVMVMDDEELVREMCKEMLIEMGHTPILAVDGRQAVALYRQSLESDAPIDLTIMDLTIPGGMGGREAVKEVLQLDPKAKVIVASGYSNDPVMADYKTFGFQGAMTKPYRFEELAALINQIL